jgi:hypothetical protein
MARECEQLETCGFLKKHLQTQELACRGFMLQYCKGPKLDQCKRRTYLQEHGTQPSDDMLPSGQTVAVKAITWRGKDE